MSSPQRTPNYPSPQFDSNTPVHETARRRRSRRGGGRRGETNQTDITIDAPPVLPSPVFNDESQVQSTTQPRSKGSAKKRYRPRRGASYHSQTPNNNPKNGSGGSGKGARKKVCTSPRSAFAEEKRNTSTLAPELDANPDMYPSPQFGEVQDEKKGGMEASVSAAPTLVTSGTTTHPTTRTERGTRHRRREQSRNQQEVFLTTSLSPTLEGNPKTFPSPQFGESAPVLSSDPQAHPHHHPSTILTPTNSNKSSRHSSRSKRQGDSLSGKRLSSSKQREEASLSNQQQSGPIQIARLLLPGHVASAVIGKHGSSIEGIRTQSQAVYEITPHVRESVFPNLRVAEVKGPSEAVHVALRQTLLRVEEAQRRASRDMKTTLETGNSNSGGNGAGRSSIGPSSASSSVPHALSLPSAALSDGGSLSHAPSLSSASSNIAPGSLPTPVVPSAKNTPSSSPHFSSHPHPHHLHHHPHGVGSDLPDVQVSLSLLIPDSYIKYLYMDSPGSLLHIQRSTNVDISVKVQVGGSTEVPIQLSGSHFSVLEAACSIVDYTNKLGKPDRLVRFDPSEVISEKHQQKTKEEPSPRQQTTIIEVSPRAAGSIIGVNGSVIEGIRKASLASIAVSGHGSGDNASVRVVTIKGPRACVMEAERLINRILDAHGTSMPPTE